jgi:hypothetical protein
MPIVRYAPSIRGTKRRKHITGSAALMASGSSNAAMKAPKERDNEACAPSYAHEGRRNDALITRYIDDCIPCEFLAIAPRVHSTCKPKADKVSVDAALCRLCMVTIPTTVP